MTTATVTIDRTSLGKAPLVIGSNPTGTYVLTDKGLGRPGVTPRLVFAADSPWVDGSVPTAATRANSELPLEVHIQAASASALAAAKADLDEALWQFTYTVTVAEGANSVTWTCYPAAHGLTDVVSDFNVADFFEVWGITIPVYPVAS